MKKINAAVIGLGCRGRQNLNTILNFENVEITCVCDVYEDRNQRGIEMVKEKRGNTPFSTVDYKEILGRSDVDVFLIFTSWEWHTKIAIDAMKGGYAVAMEVGGAYSVDECYELVQVWEETQVPFMFLENCCFGKNEMMVANMVKDGLFGEIVHCHGCYGHDLRKEITGGKENRHYRLNNYMTRSCENYPTHELGPIAKILGINRGNRMVKLVSVASKSVGLEDYVNARKDTIVNKELIGKKWAQADAVNTIITCEGGETVSIRLDTTLARPYSREFTVRGTRGMFEENPNIVYIEGEPEWHYYRDNIGNAKKYEEKYLPDMWKNITDDIINSGHGGMDYFVFKEFFDCLEKNKPMPIDVYDAAAWMCITALSEQSIKGGSVPVEIPDFTKGAYKTR